MHLNILWMPFADWPNPVTSSTEAKIPRDVAQLRFNLDDVLDCLQKLQSHHFAHSIWYESFPRWHDVYKPVYRARDGRTINLYIKLRLNRDCVVIQLCSFHD